MLGGLSISVSAEDAPVNITFVTHSFKEWNDVLDRQAREFEQANPGITVEYATVPYDDLSIKLMTGLASGEAPDVMGIYGPWMAEMVNNGWLAAAPQFVVDDIENNTFAVAGQSAQFGDNLYGYIQHIGIPIPIINQNLYDAVGAEPPTTFDELLKINEEKLDIYTNGMLTQAGTTLATGGVWAMIHWSAILQAYGVSVMNEDNTAVAFNTDQGREATEIYYNLTHYDFVPDSFIQEFSAMVWDGPWSRASYDANNPDLRYMAIEPIQGPVDYAASMYAWFWSVAGSSSPEKQDAAWKFLNFISGDEKYLEICNAIGFISFRKANYDDPTYANDPWIATFGKALEVAKIYYAKIPQWEKIEVAITRQLEMMCVGEQSLEDALNNAEAEANAILAQG